MSTTLHSSSASSRGSSTGHKSSSLGLLAGILLAFLLVVRWAIGFQTRAGTTEPIELWLEPGKLTLAPAHLEVRRLLFAEDFRYGASRWMSWTNPAVADMKADKNGLVVGPFAGSGIELSGPGGGISCLIPVEPGSALRFRGDMWVDARQPTRPEAGDERGGFLLEEMEHWPLGAALEPRRIAQYAGRRHTLKLPELERSWAPVDVTIRVGPETNALLVACVLAMHPDLNGGRVRFRSLSLERVSLNEHWHRQLREAARRLRTEPGTFWGLLANERLRLERQSTFPSRAALPLFAHRRVLVGNHEDEPGLVLLPQESIEWTLRLPKDVPVLRFELAVWTPSDGMIAGDDMDASISLQIDGRLMDQKSVHGAGSIPVQIPLDGEGGEQVVLELSASGNLPVELVRPEIATSRNVQTDWNSSRTDEDRIQAMSRLKKRPTDSVGR